MKCQCEAGEQEHVAKKSKTDESGCSLFHEKKTVRKGPGLNFARVLVELKCHRCDENVFPCLCCRSIVNTSCKNIIACNSCGFLEPVDMEVREALGLEKVFYQMDQPMARAINRSRNEEDYLRLVREEFNEYVSKGKKTNDVHLEIEAMNLRTNFLALTSPSMRLTDHDYFTYPETTEALFFENMNLENKEGGLLGERVHQWMESRAVFQRIIAQYHLSEQALVTRLVPSSVSNMVIQTCTEKRNIYKKRFDIIRHIGLELLIAINSMLHALYANPDKSVLLWRAVYCDIAQVIFSTNISK